MSNEPRQQQCRSLKSFGERGFILIMTMIIIHLISYLSLFAFLKLQTSLQTTEHYWQQIIQSSLAYTYLRQAEQQIPHCLIPIHSPNQFIQAPVSWWQQQACFVHKEKISYYYTVEWMGKDPCAHIVHHDTAPVDYYRVTIRLSVIPPLQYHGLIFQSIVARKATVSLNCHDTIHFVRPGQQLAYRLG